MNHWWIAGLLATGLLLELGLRILGFGNPLIYIADPQIGYLLAPNQQTRRFGKHIAINQYSMRSPNITATRPQETLRVLLLGDSIVNGGWWTDQSQTISALLQQQLQSQSLPNRQVEVLNASANSWAPRNQLAYLQRFGSFEAQMIVLVINTDDLFAAAPTSVVVGRDRNYPERKPVLGLIEVLQRYLLKPKPIPELATVQAEAGDRVGANLAAIQQIQQFAEKQNAKFMLLMTPLLREVELPGSRDYEQKARQRLQAFAQTNRIPLIDCLPLFNSLKQPETIYRDHIHLNPSGNQRVSTLILQQILALPHQE
ncbi:MAG: SGNH/GDSL hydrolase family protein [Leptolyngbya sp. IPPAS B-1204]|nr:MAG: SGNH/GDSL hydrolase family protein [Leptolyngbya sp. IPPAS B-1204]